MRSIALRFGDNFAPPEGTIAAHQRVLEECGSVWWGKLGNPVSDKNASAILGAEESKILLIHSGRQDRWWAYVDRIQRKKPEDDLVPNYYASRADDFHCWFHITRLERAKDDVMTRCVVPSSGRLLSNASRHSMSPFFVIEYQGE